MNTIERLEALAEKTTRLPWSYYDQDGSILDSTPDEILWIACEDDDDLGHLAVAAVNALPDFLKLARAAKAYFDAPSQPGWSSILVALEPLFREVQP